MADKARTLDGKKTSMFIDKVRELLPDGGNLNLCVTCGACTSGCPATGLEDMDPRKFLRMASLGMDEEIKASNWTWMCTLCRRCVSVCPMEIDIPELVFNARQLTPREERPKGILNSCNTALSTETHSAMGCSVEDFEFVVGDIVDEIREEDPFWEERDLQAPIDKQGAEFVINQNSREPMTEPEEMGPLWKIFNLAGADWTYTSTAWTGENYCMFLADDESWKQIVTAQAARAEDLGCKTYINTECGHVTFSVYAGLKKFNIGHSFEVKNIYEYYAKWIREGKLKVNSDWNRELKIKFTVQDPCQIVRKSYGDPIADDLRFVVTSIVGEENFVDMIPNRSSNFCCGGGGGFLQSGYKDQRLEFGKIKDNQIKATGADYCIAACHNCHTQIHELSSHFGGHYPVVHLWTLICLSMGVLGENERTYLGEDLADVYPPNVYLKD